MNPCKAFGLLLLCASIWADAAGAEPVARAETVELSATVESVDYKTRSVVLKTESGARAAVVAGPEVHNLDRVKSGDKVVLAYTIGIAVGLKPKGTPISPATESLSTERSAPGEQPRAGANLNVAATVKIDSVDTSFNTVTFTAADGVTRIVGVDDPEAQRFIRTLKRGDSVEILYREAVAIRLEPKAAH